LRNYLAQFLADRRVIELPRWFWLPLLHGVILTVRAPRSAQMYTQVWTPQGSPLIATLQRQAEGLRSRIVAQTGRRDVFVEAAARYGQPAIPAGLRRLRDAGVGRVLIFPLFPQYTAVTTATIFDVAFDELKRWRLVPELRTVQHYPDQPAYIAALADSIREGWAQAGMPERLLFSYHGIPQRYCQAGDPYEEECRRTSQLVAEKLAFPRERWQMGFQSQFGPGQWLGPATHTVLQAWGVEKCRRVDVVCPGFAADCLETLYEVAQEYREHYEQAGGGGFRYVPALNERADHLDALAQIALGHMQGWLER
jgi:ferrochelatase